MKGKYILLGALAVSIGTVGFYVSFNKKTVEGNYQPRTTESNLLMGHARSAAGAFEYYKMLKSNENTGNIEITDLIASQEAVKQHASQKATNGESNIAWKSMGPDNQGGRTYAVLFLKSDPNILFAGAVSGGLWKSTTGGSSWNEVGDFENNNISCIHQASNGTIYFGTGEDIDNADASGGSGFMGQGIWKSTDNGATWAQMLSTLPTSTNNANIEFSFVSEITTSPANPNIIYVSTNRGVRKSIDGGETWTNPIKTTCNPTAPVGRSYNVDIASDETIICDVDNVVYISTDGGESFVPQTNGRGIPNGTGVCSGLSVVASKIPNGFSRLSIDIAPSDPNYMYIQCSGGGSSFGKFAGVYRTTNKGTTWELYVPGNVPSLNIFGDQSQGWYDNVIKVHPTNKDKIFCGGIDLWSFSPTTTFERISMWFGESSETNINPYFVHADQHGIAFHPTNPDIIMFGNDGGVFITYDGGITFKEKNKGYATTQFYEMCFGPTGEVMGGLQDNGTQYIDFKGNTLRAAREVKGGDGFDSEMSWLNPSAFFATTYEGDLGRSATKGTSFSGFYNVRVAAAMKTSSFHTKIAMWESKTTENFADVTTFTATAAIAAGSTVNMVSKTASVPYKWVADADYATGDVVSVPDPVHNRFVVASQGALWMTDEALNFSGSPRWFKIAGISNGSTPGFGANDNLSNTEIISFAFSTSGEHLYIGQKNGNVYRISNLNTIKNDDEPTNKDTLSGEIGNTLNSKLTVRQIGAFSRIVTSLAVDPTNADNLVVTLGGYGSTGTYVYKSTNASSAATAANATTNFTSIQGDLPKMPVYASVIDYQNPDVIVLGTEYGIYSSSDGGSAWLNRSSGMGKVPVFSLRQQALPYNQCWNSGVLYAGTHGKGIYQSDALVGIKGNMANTISPLELKIYPNPVVETASIDFSLDKVRDVNVSVYDLNGRVVKNFNLNKKQEGTHKFTFNAEDLKTGTYLVSVDGGNDYKKLTKFVVYK